MFGKKYRVQPDSWAGYKACVKYWWWPFWINFNHNTSLTKERAWQKALHHSQSAEIKTEKELKDAMRVL